MASPRALHLYSSLRCGVTFQSLTQNKNINKMATEKRGFTIAVPSEESIQAFRDYMNEMEEVLELEFDDDEERNAAIAGVAATIPYRWNHVLFALSVLMDNCIDRNKRSLEFAPWIVQSVELLEEIDNYLNPNPQNYIGAGSKLHQQIKTVLAIPRTSEPKEKPATGIEADTK